jgi:hypothetical protein
MGSSYIMSHLSVIPIGLVGLYAYVPSHTHTMLIIGVSVGEEVRIRNGEFGNNDNNNGEPS